ncbi:Zinc-finger [Plasmodium coatneyi]|uniref:Zinc finger Ran-binding domain-containing protein 2 n=1 Tax=Plasmodium coatneyi TaxID=208452 RepID=A0A1B1DTP0_9APIC|nr:Zinc-finger [Plasmodium coatneyi]ANQ06166.1 Zinc-finger [Plasmodium coatneyi]
MENRKYIDNELTGDWICSDDKCGIVNSAQRTHCNRCNRVRPKSTMRKNPKQVLFKANDWKCEDCGNINWAKRDKCNICSKVKFPKKGSDPKSNKEVRTGKGGGHYDIQGSNEKRVHDSDDEEYDEFGRKKKRKIVDKDVKKDKDRDDNDTSRDASGYTNNKESSYKKDTYRNKQFNDSPSRNSTSNNYQKGGGGGGYYKNYYDRRKEDGDYSARRYDGSNKHDDRNRYDDRGRHDERKSNYDSGRRHHDRAENDRLADYDRRRYRRD